MADTSEQVPTPSGGGDPPAQTTGDAGGGVAGAGRNLMNGLPLGQFQAVFMRGDIALALGVVAILAILVLPMPTWLLDLSLGISITFSILILMTVLFINRALDFNAFPTVLLIATMLRLSLNLASTRLILAEGHTGTDAAGQVIQAFGQFMMSGNAVIGVIVFAILVIVNFIVITKGSGRIAEVSARFSLDAMPGKQMAIDADLSSGLIDEDEARARREDLNLENSFFGSMDGAAKFVRGDAIAGLLITVINIIGGIVIGMAQNDLNFNQAASTYTILTVGDGLVSQIPALIVSTAAGLLVTKSGTTGSADKALFNQLGGYPQALAISSGLMVILALLPGIPMFIFLALAGLTGGGAWLLNKSKIAAEAEAERAEEDQQGPAPGRTDQQHFKHRPGPSGIGLWLVAADQRDQRGPKITDQIKALRRQIAGELGFVMPQVRIQDNLQLDANVYVIRVKEIEVGRGELQADAFVGHESDRRERRLTRHRHTRANLRAAGHVDRPGGPRRGDVPRLHRGRPVDRDCDPSGRDHSR